MGRRKFELRLMGQFELVCQGQNPVPIALSSRKSRALLSYVAMLGGKPVLREQIANMLWGDRVDRQARQNLRQCIVSLRKELGRVADDVLSIDERAIAIKAEALRVDALELKALADATAVRDIERVTQLHRGQFLSDLQIKGDEFETWISAEREQLESIAARLFAKYAAYLDETGDGQKAVKMTSRLLEMDPFRDEWQRLNLRIVARHEGREKALVAARAYSALLKRELNLELDLETIKLIEQIKAGHIVSRNPSESMVYRRTAVSPQPADADKPSILSAMLRSNPLPYRHMTATMSGLSVAAFGILAGVFVLASRSVWPGGDGAEKLQASDQSHQAENVLAADAAKGDPALTSICVLRFQSAADAMAPVARTMAEDLVGYLSRFSGLKVVDECGSVDHPDESNGLLKRQIRFVVKGVVRQQAENVQINLDLVDTSNQARVWAAGVLERESRLSGVRADIVRRLSREIQVKVAYAEAGVSEKNDQSGSASGAALSKGLTMQYRGGTSPDLAKAMSSYEAALAKNPDSPLALIGVAAQLTISANNYLTEVPERDLERAELLVSRALQLDARLERAHYWMGNIRIGQGRYGQAFQAFERTLDLNPSFIPALAHGGNALVLLGQPAEGLERIKKAISMSPYDPNMHTWRRFAGIAQIELGQYQRAIAELTESAVLAFKNPSVHAALAAAFALNGQGDESAGQWALFKDLAHPSAVEILFQKLSRVEAANEAKLLKGFRLAIKAEQSRERSH